MINNSPRVAVEAFEHFMLASDSAEYPNCFFLRATWRGALECKAFQKAVGQALQRHTLLSMRLCGDVKGKTANLSWQASANRPMPRISWTVADDPLVAPAMDSSPIDLRNELGIRFFVRCSNAREGQIPEAIILLQVHQALCDPLGATSFLEDVLAVYGLPDESQAAAAHDYTRPLEPELLRLRGRFHHSTAQLRHRLVADIGRVLRLMLSSSKPKALKAKRSGATRIATVAYPAAIAYEFESSELVQLTAGAKARGGTINDLLLTELFLTCNHWQIKVDPAGGEVPMRLALAINMRKGPDHKMPACNVASIDFLERYPQAFTDHDLLFKDLARETRYLKDQNMGLAMIRFMRFAGRFQGGMQTLTRTFYKKRERAAAAFYNIGEPLRGSQLPSDGDGRLRQGGVTWERLEVLPALRSQNHLGIGAVIYAGRLTITFHYDARHLERHDVQEILDGFVEGLRAAMIDPKVAAMGWQQRLLLGAQAAGEPFWSLPIGKNVKPQAARHEVRLYEEYLP